MRKLDQNVRNCLFSKLVKNMHGRVNSKIFFQRTSIKIYLLVQLSKNSLAIVHTKMVRSTKEEERKREKFDICFKKFILWKYGHSSTFLIKFPFGLHIKRRRWRGSTSEIKSEKIFQNFKEKGEVRIYFKIRFGKENTCKF